MEIERAIYNFISKGDFDCDSYKKDGVEFFKITTSVNGRSHYLVSKDKLVVGNFYFGDNEIGDFCMLSQSFIGDKARIEKAFETAKRKLAPLHAEG